MKRILLLTIFLTSLSFSGKTKNLGCYPIIEYRINAKIFNSEGEEQTDQSCFKSFEWWGALNSNENNEFSNDSVWILYIKPGDVFVLNGRSAAENYSSADDFGLHSINIVSGLLMDHSDFTYTASGGSCYHGGSGVEATFNDSVTLEVEIPYNLLGSEKLKIQVKILPNLTTNDFMNSTEEFLISQIVGTNQVIFRSNSNKEEILEVYNYLGELVKSLTIKNNNNVSLQEIPSGIYILRVALEEKELVGKFIKQD